MDKNSGPLYQQRQAHEFKQVQKETEQQQQRFNPLKQMENGYQQKEQEAVQIKITSHKRVHTEGLGADAETEVSKEFKQIEGVADSLVPMSAEAVRQADMLLSGDQKQINKVLKNAASESAKFNSGE